MTIDENYIEKLCNTVAKTLVEAFERLTIDDVNMYQLGYNKAIDDFVEKAIEEQIQYACPLDKHDIEKIADQLKEGEKCLL